jgi:hypothetical protein
MEAPLMAPFTIDLPLILDLGRYAASSVEDGLLLAKVRARHPTASLTEIRRAALYIITDPVPENAVVAIRMSKFVKCLCQ